MTELIDGYNHLMSDEFGKKVGDSRVAIACEMYTIEELKMDRLHDVYTIRILYDFDGEQDNLTEETSSNDSLEKSATNENSETQLNPEVIIEVLAHPDDSVSDLKRHLQDRFCHEWGLNGRKLDREGLGTGWELITQNGLLLGSWFFLNSYDIEHNDKIHAVVRRYDETMK